MGNSTSKLNFRKAVIQLTAKNQAIDDNDENFWSQFWSSNITSIQDIYTLIPAFEIRAVREEAPTNLAALCYKIVLKIKELSESSLVTEKNQISVLNCVRLLTRILPYIFEESEWRGFFWSDFPSNKNENKDSSTPSETPLSQILLDSLINLLFVPDFTVHPHKKNTSSEEEKLKTIDSCEYIWEAGVGFSHSPPQNYTHDYNRTEILKLLLSTFSETIYLQPSIEYHAQPNLWISYFTSFKNQHALPLFTSLINIIFSYDPVGYGLPYNYLMFTDSREALVEVSCQLLCVVLESNININNKDQNHSSPYSIDDSNKQNQADAMAKSNLFINYISRIHRDEDFSFILKGFCRLLNNPIQQTFLPGSNKKIQFHQELLILFWKFCDYNKKFMYFVLKSSEVLDILVPILYFLVDARADTCKITKLCLSETFIVKFIQYLIAKIGLIHIGVFILLLLSGERNFGVRLNKPYISRIPIDIPVFSGTHADLLIIVFHKLITSTNHRLQPLYDCLLTIIVNISPYIKSLSMVASTKILHLLEAFSNNAFLFSNPNNYYLVFFILEVLNNIIQYQFDGNCNLVYTIIRKRNVFFNLINLPTDQNSIDAVFTKQIKKSFEKKKSDASLNQLSNNNGTTGLSQTKSMEGAIPAKEAEPGTLKATLAETPSILNMTEKTLSSMDKELAALDNNTASKLNTESNNNDNFVVYNSNSNGNGSKEPLSNNNNEIEQLNNSIKDINVNNNLNESSLLNSSQYKQNNISTNSTNSINSSSKTTWTPTSEWLLGWKSKLPLQTIMRLLQVLVPQVEKICLDKGLTDESEILKFLQNGTLVGLLPVPHPILIRKYQPNFGTLMWFRTYLWGVIYLRNLDPPIFYDTNVQLFEIQRI